MKFNKKNLVVKDLIDFEYFVVVVRCETEDSLTVKLIIYCYLKLNDDLIDFFVYGFNY
jgi:hypothetical protein